LKQTVDPEPGYAVKEVFFTQKGENVYAILPQYPKNKIVLKNVQTKTKTKIALLGSDKKVLWKQKGNDLEITMPSLYADELPCDYAWVLKLDNIENKKDR
jgi:alpha-L-fucosidase